MVTSTLKVARSRCGNQRYIEKREVPLYIYRKGRMHEVCMMAYILNNIQKVEKGHFWADSVGGRGHCQLVRLMMGAMRCLVVAPPVHAPWGSARAVTSHACRRRPTECRSVAGDGSCGAPAGLHEAAGGASSRGLSTLACASARGRAMRGCQDASVGSRWRLKCPCPAVSPSLRCLI